MKLLDTNIVSAVMAPRPPQLVLEWLDQEETLDLYVSVITLAEIGYGLSILPAGQRRTTLEQRFTAFITKGFDQRLLDFDAASARCYGGILAHRRSLGKPMSVFDGQLAAIARARDMVIVTRNVRDFEHCGLEILNPFDARGPGM